MREELRLLIIEKYRGRILWFVIGCLFMAARDLIQKASLPTYQLVAVPFILSPFILWAIDDLVRQKVAADIVEQVLYPSIERTLYVTDEEVRLVTLAALRFQERL